jgi:hypothetical protein
MTFNPMYLESIAFTGPTRSRTVEFVTGVNVVCGASETGKSFLAESIDFMLGGSTLREIPERLPYAGGALKLSTATDGTVELTRSLAGGNFQLRSKDGTEAATVALRAQHAHDRTDNLSGYLLNEIGLGGKRILKSKAKSTTQSLSFRNLARLVIVQEGEIQSLGSPFLSGQYTSRTSDLATVKLLLTGVDDATVVTIEDLGSSNVGQIALIEEIISDLSSEIEDIGDDRGELEAQLERLDATVETRREEVRKIQRDLDLRLNERKTAYAAWATLSNREAEIGELVARFALLEKHYGVDQERLRAVEENGSLFVYISASACPLCGALPEAQHSTDECDGDTEAIVIAARAEGYKIARLLAELKETVADLEAEAREVALAQIERRSEYDEFDSDIRMSIAPLIDESRAQFSEIIEHRAHVQAKLDMFERLGKIEQRRDALVAEESDVVEKEVVNNGIPEAAAHAISMTVERLLKAWSFPGECRVHFDQQKSDFVIDGKPRGSRGKGLRAISHAAINIALLEYCRERSLPHPGFVVLDSPLLAYYEPEGPEDEQLQGSDLKERFYDYLTKHHHRDSQIIIIENQHPPVQFNDRLALTVFTRSPSLGRFGFL